MRTRVCIWYVAGYLIVSGLALVLAPGATLSMMFSDADYGLVMPRWVGMLSLALGTLVGQVVRHGVVVLYPLSFFMPAAMLVGFVGIYLQSRNPLFLGVIAVVGVGVVTTGMSMLIDRVSSRAERRG